MDEYDDIEDDFDPSEDRNETVPNYKGPEDNQWVNQRAVEYAIELAKLNGTHDTESVITAAHKIAAFINGEQANG